MNLEGNLLVRRVVAAIAMRIVRLARVIALLAMVVLAAPNLAPAFDFSSLLGSSDTPRFKIIHVNDLAGLRASHQQKVVVLDANYPPVRNHEGVIPGAVMLSSESRYDVTKELPHDKSAKLVFYCHNKA